MQVPCPPATVRERRRRLVWPGIQSFERRTSPLLAMVTYGTCLVRQRYAVPEQRAQVTEQIGRLSELPLLHQPHGLLAATLAKTLFLTDGARLPHGIQQHLGVRTVLRHQPGQRVFGFLHLAPSEKDLGRSKFFAIF